MASTLSAATLCAQTSLPAEMAYQVKNEAFNNSKVEELAQFMTDDLGVLSPGEDCGCGIPSPYLTILGRVGVRDIQTCAAGAAQLLGKGEGF